MYFNSSLVHVDILVLKLKMEVKYLGHNIGKEYFRKNGVNQTLRSLESQNYLFTLSYT